MRSVLKSVVVAAAMVMGGMTVWVEVAEAARLGGGKSMGRQSSGITQRQATPPATPPRQNADQASPSQAQPAPARQNPAATQPPRNRWLAPLAGLAAGLGLAALASHLGLGEEFASILLVALLAFVAVVVVRMLLARRAAAGPRPAYQGAGYGNTGIGSEATVNYQPLPQPDRTSAPTAAPVVRPAGAPEAPSHIPADFDVEGFLRHARPQFVRLQGAFDASNLDELREFTTPEMFDALRQQIVERSGASNRTDVVRLDAELLGIESDADEHVASVRFHGLIREREGGPAEAFDEVWHLTKPVSGSAGWVLAGIQQLN